MFYLLDEAAPLASEPKNARNEDLRIRCRVRAVALSVEHQLGEPRNSQIIALDSGCGWGRNNEVKDVVQLQEHLRSSDLAPCELVKVVVRATEPAARQFKAGKPHFTKPSSNDFENILGGTHGSNQSQLTVGM